MYVIFFNDFSKKIIIATGQKIGGYYKIAKEYQRELKKEGIYLEIKETKGSIEALSLLESNIVDMAFIQGGVSSTKSNNLVSLASVFYEPLWVFYRKKLDVKYLNDLKNKRVSIGEIGSGTNALFSMLLKENNIKKDKLFTYSNDKALELVLSGKIDAFCIVSSHKAEIIQKALRNNDISLLNFHRDKAYKKKFDYINSLVLNSGVIDLSKNIPFEDVTLFATTASLVVKKDFNQSLQKMIIKYAKKIHEHNDIFTEKNFFPSTNFVDFPISLYTKKYLEKGETIFENYFPFWLISLIENFIIIILPLLPTVYILIKVILPRYYSYFRYRVYIIENELLEIELKYENLNAIERKEVFDYLINTRKKVERN